MSLRIARTYLFVGRYQVSLRCLLSVLLRAWTKTAKTYIKPHLKATKNCETHMQTALKNTKKGYLNPSKQQNTSIFKRISKTLGKATKQHQTPNRKHTKSVEQKMKNHKSTKNTTKIVSKTQPNKKTQKQKALSTPQLLAAAACRQSVWWSSWAVLRRRPRRPWTI